MPSTEQIKTFIHDQVDLWNAKDREGFFACYKKIAKGRLVIEYVGRPIPDDAWQVLEQMWDTTNSDVEIEVAETIINGNEVACHHINKMPSKGINIQTVEIYKFDGDDLYVRYFIKPEPATAV